MKLSETAKNGGKRHARRDERGRTSRGRDVMEGKKKRISGV